MACSQSDALASVLLLPEPWRFQRLPGVCVLEGHVTVSSANQASNAAAELLASELRARGLSASSASSSAASAALAAATEPRPETSSSVAVSVTVAPGSTPSLDSNPLGASEGYELEVTPTALAIRASSAAGAFYALQTLRQLLPPPPLPSKEQRRRRRRAERSGGDHSVSSSSSSSPSLSLLCLEVADAPRFAWRGLLLDVARHFFDARFVVGLIRAISSFKMNVLHLHLVDDQGWRLPGAEGLGPGKEGDGRRGQLGRRAGGGGGQAVEEEASPPPAAAAAAFTPSSSSPSPLLCETHPLLSELGAWRGDSRREAVAWRAERRRRRRERRRRRRRRRKERGEAEEEETKEEEGAASKGEGDDDDNDDDEILGASPSSSSEGSSSSSSSSPCSSDEGEEKGSGKGEGERRLDRRRRVRAGGRFSARDVSRILEAASACHVSVVPEVDLPGHCGAAIAAYPELSCEGVGARGGERGAGGGESATAALGGSSGGAGDNDALQQQQRQTPLPPPPPPPPAPPPRSPVPVLWGVHSHVLCSTSAPALRFVDSLLRTAAALFPSSRFVHVGGDEVPHGPWGECQGCRSRAAGLLLEGGRGRGGGAEGGGEEEEEAEEEEKDDDGGGGVAASSAAAAAAAAAATPFRGELLHSWFLHRAEASLSKLGRRTVAWCDALDAEAVAAAAAAAEYREEEARAAAGGSSDGGGGGGAANAPAPSSSPSRLPPSPPPSSASSSSSVVMCWRGGGAPGARAAAEGRDVVMCPAGRCYLDYRQADSKSLCGSGGGEIDENGGNESSEEPGAWYATLTLRDCWEFDPLIIDEAVAVVEGGVREGREVEAGNEEARAEEADDNCCGGEGLRGDCRAESEEPTLGGGGGDGDGESLRSTSGMAESTAGVGGGGSGEGEGEDGGGGVSSRLVAAVRGGEPPAPIPVSQHPPPPPPPYGASLAMASSADNDDDYDDAATMSGAGGTVVGRAADGGEEGDGEDEDEVAGPAEKPRNGVKPQEFRLRRVPLPESSRKRILGGQACLWTEYVPDEATATYMLFPRLLATAESLWSPALRERKAFSAAAAAAGGGGIGSSSNGDGKVDGEGRSETDGDEATECAWRDFVSRARAQGPRLDPAGWRERRKLSRVSSFFFFFLLSSFSSSSFFLLFVFFLLSSFSSSSSSLSLV